jgi:hypothetical protein
MAEQKPEPPFQTPRKNPPDLKTKTFLETESHISRSNALLQELKDLEAEESLHNDLNRKLNIGHMRNIASDLVAKKHVENELLRESADILDEQAEINKRRAVSAERARIYDPRRIQSVRGQISEINKQIKFREEQIKNDIISPERRLERYYHVAGATKPMMENLEEWRKSNEESEEKLKNWRRTNPKLARSPKYGEKMSALEDSKRRHLESFYNMRDSVMKQYNVKIEDIPQTLNRLTEERRAKIKNLDNNKLREAIENDEEIKNLRLQKEILQREIPATPSPPSWFQKTPRSHADLALSQKRAATQANIDDIASGYERTPKPEDFDRFGVDEENENNEI